MAYYQTAFISDTHLGMPHVDAKPLELFLNKNSFGKIIIAGDFIDLVMMKIDHNKSVHAAQQNLQGQEFVDFMQHWILSRLRPAEREAIKRLSELAADGTEVIFVPGNHDIVFRAYGGCKLFGAQICPEHIHTLSDGRRMLIKHGDEFDTVISHSKKLEFVGSHVYDWLLFFGAGINSIRYWLGCEEWSLAAWGKNLSKKAVKHISRFEEAVAAAAQEHQVCLIGCGHIHKPEIRPIGDVVYINFGDFVESNSALVEDSEGHLKMLRIPAWKTAGRSMAPIPKLHLPAGARTAIALKHVHEHVRGRAIGT